MRQRATWVLLIVFVSAIGSLWWAEYARVPTNARKRLMAGRVLPELLDRKPTEIRRIEIDRRGKDDKLALSRRDDGGWQLRRPWDVAADSEKVDTLLRSLFGLQKFPDSGTVDDDPKAFDLDPPLFRIRLYDNDGERPAATLEVGRLVRNLRSVRTPDAKGIELIDNAFLGPIDTPLIDWRDRTLLTFASFQVEKVAVDDRNPDRNVEVARIDEKWQMTEPMKALADSFKVESLIAELGALRVIDGPEGFVANDLKPAQLAEYGLQPPWMTVNVEPYPSARRPTSVVMIGNPVPGKPDQVYALRGGQNDLVRIDIKRMRDVLPNPLALRSLDVLDFDPQKVGKISISLRRKTLELARSADHWELLGPTPGVAEASQVDQFLGQLKMLKASEILKASDVSDPMTDPPLARIQAWPAEAASASQSSNVPLFDLRLGRVDSLRKTVYGQVAGESSVFAIPDSALQILPRNSFAFRSLSVVSLNPAAIKRLDIKSEGKAVSVVSPGSSQRSLHWLMVEPVKSQTDEAAITNLITTLSDLRAEAWISDTAGDLKSYCLDRPILEVDWELDPSASLEVKSKGSSNHGRLRVGALKPGTTSFYSAVDGNDAVFLLSALMVEPLAKELHSRSVLRFKMAELRQAVFEWQDGKVLVAPSDDLVSLSKWRAVKKSGQPRGNISQFEALLNELSNLSTTRFLQYQGPIDEGTGLLEPTLAIRLTLAIKGRLDEVTLKVGKRRGDSSRYFATLSKGGSGSTFVLAADPHWADLLTSTKVIDGLPEDVFAPLPVR